MEEAIKTIIKEAKDHTAFDFDAFNTAIDTAIKFLGLNEDDAVMAVSKHWNFDNVDKFFASSEEELENSSCSDEMKSLLRGMFSFVED